MFSRAHCILLVATVLFVLAMVAPGGVVVEGQLNRQPEPGTTVPFSITVTKGGLEYFGRILISLPPDVRLKGRQLLGGNLTEEDDRNIAVISWLKLPEADQFQLQLDLEVAPNAAPGFRSLEWDFSFIRNNDRVSVRPAPFHFEVISPSSTLRDTPTNRETTELDPTVATTDVVQVPSAYRTLNRLRDGNWQCEIQLADLPEGGFVKLSERIPPGCLVEVTSGGGSVTQLTPQGVDFVWFDYRPMGLITYRLTNCSLSAFGEIIGALSYVNGDYPKEIPVIPRDGLNSDAGASIGDDDSEDVRYEIQVAATKNRVVTDYFKEKFEFAHLLAVEEEKGWFKYAIGSHRTYEEARRQRNEVSDAYAFIGPFVIARSGGARIPVQEALLRTGQVWMP